MVQTLALDPQEDSSQLRPFTYTACYCEENVYLLCKSLLEAQNGRHLQPAALCVVFISNDARKVCSPRTRRRQCFVCSATVRQALFAEELL